jgi:hypothetical protein
MTLKVDVNDTLYRKVGLFITLLVQCKDKFIHLSVPSTSLAPRT